jgi:hypothetical protein
MAEKQRQKRKNRKEKTEKQRMRVLERQMGCLILRVLLLKEWKVKAEKQKSRKAEKLKAITRSNDGRKN